MPKVIHLWMYLLRICLTVDGIHYHWFVKWARLGKVTRTVSDKKQSKVFKEAVIIFKKPY